MLGSRKIVTTAIGLAGLGTTALVGTLAGADPSSLGAAHAVRSLKPTSVVPELPKTLSMPWLNKMQAQWPPSAGPGQSYLSQAAAIAIARRGAAGGPTNAPAFAQMTSYDSASKMLGDGPNPAVIPSTKVWIVTVDAAFGAISAPPGVTLTNLPKHYTIIIDAVNGQPIDAGTVAALGPNSSS